MAAAASRFGKIDHLVCNAAISPPLPVLMPFADPSGQGGTSPEAFQKIMASNVTQQYVCVREAAPYIPEQTGTVTFISSLGAYAPGSPHPAHGISKLAIHGLTKALSNEFASKKIRVNCASPAMVKTAFSRPLWSNPDAEAAISAHMPLGRLGEAEEVSGVVAFLASRDASYVTGEITAIGGGAPSH